MIKTFFEPDSINEVNTTKQFIEDIKNSKDKADIDLFKEVENEIYQSCFIESFNRMQKTPLWNQLINSKKKKVKQSILL